MSAAAGGRREAAIATGARRRSVCQPHRHSGSCRRRGVAERRDQDDGGNRDNPGPRERDGHAIPPPSGRRPDSSEASMDTEDRARRRGGEAQFAGTAVPVFGGSSRSPMLLTTASRARAGPSAPPSQFHSMNLTIDECSIVHVRDVVLLRRTVRSRAAARACRTAACRRARVGGRRDVIEEAAALVPGEQDERAGGVAATPRPRRSRTGRRSSPPRSCAMPRVLGLVAERLHEGRPAGSVPAARSAANCVSKSVDVGGLSAVLA